MFEALSENDLVEGIIGFCIKIHNVLGPGLMESVYEKALSHELKRAGYRVENQKQIPVVYDGQMLGEGFRADLVVNNKVIIELKSVKRLEDVFYKQVLTYLRLSGIKLGLLINFNDVMLKNSIKRIVNGL